MKIAVPIDAKNMDDAEVKAETHLNGLPILSSVDTILTETEYQHERGE